MSTTWPESIVASNWATIIKRRLWCCACVVMSDVIRVGRYHIANVYKPPTEHWISTNLPPVLPHPAVLVGDFNSHYPDWGYQEADLDGESVQEWALNSDYLLLHDAKQRGTFHSLDLCWISWSILHSSAFLPQLKVYSVRTRLYSWPSDGHFRRRQLQSGLDSN